jgi:short subunit dehydrogenase-like uncharacterized protein
MITLFGATGFTGRLIAKELDCQQMPFRIAGRSKEKLQALAKSLSSKPDVILADARQVSTLPFLFKDSHMLINCAGPFTDLGEQVISRAAMSGSAYLDVTNELGYAYRALSYQSMAQKTGAVLVPACGFEVSLADCAAHLCAKELERSARSGSIDAVQIVYKLDGRISSKGTRKSAVRSLATSWLSFENGEWKGAFPGEQTRVFDLPAGKLYGFTIPSCESLTVPSHLDTKQVKVWMAGPKPQAWKARLLPLLARLSRSILRPLILQIAASGGKGGEEFSYDQDRLDTSFFIYICCEKGSSRRWISLAGSDPYGLTAKIAVYAAGELSREETRPKPGILAPALAFDPEQFLRTAASQWNIQIERGSD